MIHSPSLISLIGLASQTAFFQSQQTAAAHEEIHTTKSDSSLNFNVEVNILFSCLSGSHISLSMMV